MLADGTLYPKVIMIEGVRMKRVADTSPADPYCQRLEERQL
jgi:hypothetical protein